MAYLAGSPVTAKVSRTPRLNVAASPLVNFYGHWLTGSVVTTVWHRLPKPGLFATVTSGTTPPPTKGQLWPRIIR